jgi:prepilin-type processing-associated H-X9-DG protein
MAKSAKLQILEIAAVIGIALTVAELIFIIPILFRPVGRAPQSQSLNNVKQLALGVIMYAQDYDQHFPGWVQNPDGRFAHNTWDEQVNAQIKSKDVFLMGQDGPGIRSYSDPKHERVVTYGMNGLLITPPRPVFDGRADFNASDHRPLAVGEIADPENVILIAEMATWETMPGTFGKKPDPVPFTFGAFRVSNPQRWEYARDGWIDISPREWLENSPAPGCYEPRRWNKLSGVGRDQYPALGAAYGFVDGHVKWLLPGETINDGSVPPDRYWSPDNPHNMWNPHPSHSGRRNIRQG